ncbi:flagellar hook-length control protein FliK [Paenarthrobacter ureafaciens]|uniref:flagellar hook-length control protein FliK n=1 Tax=Paenarthrobacter ureafaciens TaxID=37931 RepID=UPI00140E3210|nr:flagellar hook-length control protein FliK [Paenarthrobacter ureafaciens]MCX8454260.1 flagellar hook-length control protein FliK [Paenarthrobacter ureafaciens]MCY0972466.1 flagellar hook-length control protein FliK [Paenarthrobacter ureafaciens]WNZ05627.1 flagellar hook-length control protein FliK [Paenarthrobacter ureafaciens]
MALGSVVAGGSSVAMGLPTAEGAGGPGAFGDILERLLGPADADGRELPGDGNVASAQDPQARFVGSLRSVPGARHTPQRGIEVEGTTAPEAALSGVGEAPGPVRLDDSLRIRRFLPSNTQEAVEVEGAAVIPVPGARHTPQRGIEAEGTPVPGTHLSGVADVSSQPPLDDSLPVRQLLPSSGQRSVEAGGAAVIPVPDAASSSGLGVDGGVPVASVEGGPAGSHSEIRDIARFVGSLRSVPSARHDPQRGIESEGVPAQAMPAAVVHHAQVQPQAQPAQLQPAQPQPATPHQATNQPLAHQLTQPLFTLATAKPGEHVMTLRVSPEDLGPLTVRAHIDGGGVRIELFAAGDAGREAVRHVLPELRRGLEEMGASLSLSSDDSPQTDRRPHDNSQGQHHPHDNPRHVPTGEGPASGNTELRAPVPQGPREPALDASRNPGPQQTRLDILV